jgi:peptidase E
MTTIFERVKSAMDTLSPAVAHSLAPYKAATLPDTYIVYQLIDGSPEQHADNAETQRTYMMQVTTWSKAGLVNLPNVKAAMTAAGFQKSGERQLPQDQETGHYGLATDYVYLE